MELFDRDDFLTDDAKEEEKFKQARKRFTKRNKDMTDRIDKKVIDNKNVDYGKVHVEIYDGVGLGKKWRVNKSKDSAELNTASNGFVKVSDELDKRKSKFYSEKLIRLIASIFKK